MKSNKQGTYLYQEKEKLLLLIKCEVVIWL
jgi:hypothetical protein